MSTEENKKIVLAYFAERSAGDPRAFDHFADSATWMIMAKSSMGGTRTKAELLEIVKQNTARFEVPVSFKVTGVTAEGDRVAIEAEGYAKLKNGKTYENNYHFLFVVKDGKIQLGKEYCDFHYAVEVLRP
ncbi:MAG TPA: nuclear transport factor 2 family protein [Candidatus Binataceae bacterium]|jgi:ketosteroid isomerase-like protein|nr:nuclear transport factor 2 family protein [Candidatus Binataceae bacterium]